MDEVILGPGQRASAIVVGGQPGTHVFKSVPFQFDKRQPALPEVSLGTVVAQGPSADIAAVERNVLEQRVNAPLYVEVVRSSPIAHRRTFVFSANSDGSQFTINNQVFDENRTVVMSSSAPRRNGPSLTKTRSITTSISIRPDFW